MKRRTSKRRKRGWRELERDPDRSARLTVRGKPVTRSITPVQATRHQEMTDWTVGGGPIVGTLDRSVRLTRIIAQMAMLEERSPRPGPRPQPGEPWPASLAPLVGSLVRLPVGRRRRPCRAIVPSSRRRTVPLAEVIQAIAQNEGCAPGVVLRQIAAMVQTDGE